MSSIHLQLQPFALDSCSPNSLRERRRSSIRPRALFPKLFQGTNANIHGGDEDSAVDDEVHEPIAQATREGHLPIQYPSPLVNAHLSGYSTNAEPTRHQDTLPRLHYTSEPQTPSQTSPTASSKNSIVDIPPVVPVSPPERLAIRLAAGYFMYFMCGWGDGVTGAVIPYFERDFHLTPLTSSLLFASSTVGFAAATVLVEWISKVLSNARTSSRSRSFFPANPWFSRTNLKGDIGTSPTQGRYFAIVYFSVLHASFFVLMGSRGGYPVLLLAYAFAAYARGIITAQLNLYFSTFSRPSLGYAYATWSFGGAISPLICQTIVAKGVPWNHFYYGSLVLSAFNTCFLAYSFRPTLKEFADDRQTALGSISDSEVKQSQSSLPSISRQTSGIVSDKAASPNAFTQAVKLPYLWAVCVFSWLYCGSETTTQGFIVSYLLAVRSADRNTAGYVTSGFWGGITVGRLLWGRYNYKITFTRRKYIILALLYVPHLVVTQPFAYTTWNPDVLVALVMQLLIWFVNSNAGNAFSASMIGVVYGPMFPACLALANDLLPHEVHMVSMGIISAFASLGASLFPFFTGTIATVKGMQTLSYMTVAQGVVLIGIWYLFPSLAPRRT
ncbi:hypothetical protein PTI98_001589 [Pleurotus ostreatus]|nr:hypothetical protein PTI98_001589 [Pleurotus ostreatus]